MFTRTGLTNASLVWHPVKARYYSLRPGNAAFPLETWVAGSSTSVCTATAGVDSRGLWYNPATNAIERNCFGTLGWATLGIDAASCATKVPSPPSFQASCRPPHNPLRPSTPSRTRC
ncbi:MAG: hypothetical protein IPO17_17545 [Flavobacteriales bacterium]|nr:hypothetical protein [Flavobacteriales bacterium]